MQPDSRPTPPTRRRSATIATALSFLWPGLGQAYAARPRRALLFAVPALAFATLVVWQLVSGIETFALRFLTPTIAASFTLLAVATAVWRILSMGDAIQVTDPRSWRRPSTLTTFGVLGLVTVLMHGSLAWGLWSVYDAGSKIFTGDDPGSEPGATPNPSNLFPATPVGTPPPPGERITVLITGIDSQPGRSTNLTDTMIVASMDPDTGET